MEIKLELETTNFKKASDQLLVEMAFHMQAASTSISTLASLMGINRSVLSRKLFESGHYDEFVSRYKDFVKVKRNSYYKKKSKKLLEADGQRHQRLAAYVKFINNKEAVEQLVPLPLAQVVDAAPQLSIGVQHVSK